MKENIFGMKHFDFVVDCIISLSLKHEIQRGR